MSKKVFFIFFVSFLSVLQQVVCIVSEEPLILTSLIESGNISEAQEKSRVSPDIIGIKSYTGFLTVDKHCGNNLFFWFVPAEQNWNNAPVILWLTGGPGTSSLFALFGEVGPFKWNNDTKQIEKNENSWTSEWNILFVDQPVGTGFSYTEKGCYLRTNVEIAKQVYSALEQFYLLFPNLQKNELWLAGESYTGTYQPAIGVEIHKRNRGAKVKMNLKGLLLGNPYLDLKCLKYARYWYEIGLIEEDRRDRIEEYQEIRNIYISLNNSKKANEYENKIWSEEFSRVGLPSIFNTLYNKELALTFKYYVTEEKTRRSIHVGNTHYNVTSSNGIVGKVMEPELIVPATHNVQYMLDRNYSMVFYTGQLDVQCIYSGLVCVLDQLKHPEYQKAKRQRWYVDGQLAGWVRRGGNMMSFVVRGAGHIVPSDQPKTARTLARAAVGGGGLDLQE